MSKKQQVDISTGEIFDVVTKPITRPVKTQYNAELFTAYYEVNGRPSETIPDQTMSLKVLLERHARGLPITGNPSAPEYYGDEQMPDLNKMDISEIHALKNAVKSDIQKMQQDLADKKKAADQAAYDKRINDEVEKRVKSKPSDKEDSKPIS